MRIPFTQLLFSVLFALCLNTATIAQIEVNNAATPEEAVDILLGDGVDALNITFSGDPEQIGSFNGIASNLGLDEGVVMGTGDVDLVSGVTFDPYTFEQITGVGGNNGTGNSLGNANFGVNDPDLDQLSTFDTNDAAILEFDFVPTGDSVSFRYVFASEEYNEYVCGSVNDAFGFFLSGPGINGPYTNNAINLALVPGTDIPVTINTVNNGTVGNNGFIDNCTQVSAEWDQNTIYFVDNSTQTTDVEVIEFDGFTVVLQTSAEVICGETYHIKIAIADGGDTAFDSGVFLQKDSFTSQGVNLFANISSALNDSTVYEGCGLAEVVFQRSAGLADQLDINVEYSGSALYGVDYFDMPDIITLLPGESTGTLNFETIADGISEGLETVTFSVDVQACNSDSAEFTLYIDDTPLELELETTTPFCPGDDVVLTANVTGGLPDYDFVWSNGANALEQTINPLSPEAFNFSVEDQCGNTLNESILAPVPVPEPLIASINENHESECPEDHSLSALVSGGLGDYSYLWSIDGLEVSQASAFTSFFDQDSNVSLIVNDQCGDEDSDEVEVIIGDYEPLSIDAGRDTTLCFGQGVNLVAISEGGASNHSYFWSNNANAALNAVAPLNTRTYEVTVTDECGIQANDEVTVTISHIEADFDMEWNSGNDYAFENQSQEADSYFWTFGDGGFSEEENPVHTYADIYGYYDIELVVSNEFNCRDSIRRSIAPPLDIYVPNTFTPDFDGVNDVFEYALNGVEKFEMIIFNRWGEEVWRTTTPGDFWDGSHQNGTHFVPDGSYIWVMKVEALNFFTDELTGTVSIIR